MTATPQEESSRQLYYIEQCAGIISERARARGRALQACVTTFGCQMNERDSEKLRGILLKAGYDLTDSAEGADLVLFNTCTVRENANLKVYGRLGTLLHEKKKNPEMIIALCGCMMQEPDVVEKIRKSYTFVDLVFGTHNLFKFAELLYQALSGSGMIVDIWKGTDRIVEELPTQRTYSFKSGVNIMFGCNNFCTYCIVPYVRGRERSRTSADIIKEVSGLAGQGVVEVMLLGQNVNSYGKGLDEQITFAQLLRQVARVDGIRRVRFMTSHPKDLSDDLIEVMATEPNVCPHLHLPLQSGSTPLLKKMNRHYTKEGYLALCEKLKQSVPDLSLTTDIIVGFPGETEADFLETMDVVEQVRYDSAFTFIYSKRTGTPAASMPDQVPEDVIKDRFDRLLERVQTIGRERSARFAGRRVPVLVEHVNTQDPSLVTGREAHNLVVHFPGDPSLIGKIVDVELETCKGFYYLGRQ